VPPAADAAAPCLHGAEVPYPYGGKPRVIMADLDSQALQARGVGSFDSLNPFCAPQRYITGGQGASVTRSQVAF
jgi:hypothetical protein